MTKSIRVVAATIRHNGRFLITQRRPEGVLPLLWEFPGGRVEPGETDAEALRREVFERTGADVEVGDELATRLHDYVNYSVTLVIREATLTEASAAPSALRVNDVRWVGSDEFEQYEFPPADEATMNKLLGIGRDPS